MANYKPLMLRYETLTDISESALQRFDLIIDARAPIEYAEDHLPGAVNLPVLSDDERAQIGTTYLQDSPFEARRAGAALVARNVARHLETSLADQPKKFRPLVYCWRGGMRSNSMATILAAVGWPVAVLEGGYRTWRRGVVDGIERSAPRLKIVLIDGQTGTAKTAILQELKAQGAQMIDLEGLAHHRGSIFGDFTDQDQPSQKAFETGLWCALEQLDPERPVFVEAESALIGKCRIPAPFLARMRASPRLEITVPVHERARYLTTAYADLMIDTEKMQAALDVLIQHHSHGVVNAWRKMAEEGAYEALASALVCQHYDPAYDRARAKRPRKPEFTLETRSLSSEALSDLARVIIARADRLA